MTSITINIDMRWVVFPGVIHGMLAKSNMYPMNIDSVCRSVTLTCEVVIVCFICILMRSLYVLVASSLFFVS